MAVVICSTAFERLPQIKGIGIGQEWQTLALFYLFHNLAHIDRADKPVISPLSKMEFE